MDLPTACGRPLVMQGVNSDEPNLWVSRPAEYLLSGCDVVQAKENLEFRPRCKYKVGPCQRSAQGLRQWGVFPTFPSLSPAPHLLNLGGALCKTNLAQKTSLVYKSIWVGMIGELSTVSVLGRSRCFQSSFPEYRSRCRQKSCSQAR